jgi:chromosome segregation ATPase
MEVTSEPQPDLNSLEQEIQSLRKLHDDQEAELVQLRTLKRKLEDDYSYERSIRRKYQRQLDDLEKECKFAHQMERYALDQIKREVITRRKAEEETKLEKKMRQALIQISDKRFGFDDIINLCEKKKEAEDP